MQLFPQLRHCASVTHGAAISTIATLPRPTGYDNETLRAQNKFTICRANWHPSGILWTAHGHYPRTVRTARKVVWLAHTWLHNKINQLCLKLLNGLFCRVSWARLVGINVYTPGTVELRTPRHFDKMLLDSPSLNLEGLKGTMRTCSSWSPTDLRRPRVWTWDIPPTFCKLNTVNCRQTTWSTLFSNNPRWRQHLIHLLVCASKQRKGWGSHLDWNPLILSFWIIPTRRFKWIQYIQSSTKPRFPGGVP